MKAGTKIEAELTDVSDDCLCAANRPRRPVEGREESVARGVELPAAEAGEASRCTEAWWRSRRSRHARSPSAARSVERDDVGEEDRREDAVRNGQLLPPAQEARDRGRYLTIGPRGTVPAG